MYLSNCGRNCGQPQSSAHSKQLNVKDKCGVRRDHTSGSACAVAEIRRDYKPPLATYSHACYALNPSLDDTAFAKLEFERAAMVA